MIRPVRNLNFDQFVIKHTSGISNGVRTLQITTLCFLALYLTGCKGSQQRKPLSEQVKIGDISPSDGDKQPVGKSINTIDFDVHIFEIPAENIDKINDAWGLLYTEPLRYHSYQAFTASSFVVRFARVRMWDRINDMLRAAGGQKIVTVSLLLPDGQANDIIVKGLNTEQSVFYISADGQKESAAIGPGILCLRIKAAKIPDLRDVCELTAYPVFTVPASSSIPELSARAKSREFSFLSAAFGLRMSPGDFIMLGPEKNNLPTAGQTTLDGLFFSNPQGSLFPGTTERTAPKLKPAIRVFLLTCVGMSN